MGIESERGVACVCECEGEDEWEGDEGVGVGIGVAEAGVGVVEECEGEGEIEGGSGSVVDIEVEVVLEGLEAGVGAEGVDSKARGFNDERTGEFAGVAVVVVVETPSLDESTSLAVATSAVAGGAGIEVEFGTVASFPRPATTVAFVPELAVDDPDILEGGDVVLFTPFRAVGSPFTSTLPSTKL